MKIVVFGATGNVGRRIVAEALRRGHEVVGVVRDPDAAVSAISPRPNSRGLPAPRLADNARALIEGLRKAGVKRVVFIGGASSLEVAPGEQLLDQPGFPGAYKAEAEEGRDALRIWRGEADGLEWTYLSPAAEIGPGERTGRYRTTDDRLLLDASGKSFITYEDLAAAVLDELEQPKHVGRRFGVAY
jgi:hypothetical protein